MASKSKNDRIDLRAKKSQKDYLAHAATLCGMKLSSFVLESALKEAEAIVNQNVHFALSEKQWKDFCSALDQPACEIPKLKKLVTGPDIFDERKTAA